MSRHASCITRIHGVGKGDDRIAACACLIPCLAEWWAFLGIWQPLPHYISTQGINAPAASFNCC